MALAATASLSLKVFGSPAADTRARLTIGPPVEGGTVLDTTNCRLAPTGSTGIVMKVAGAAGHTAPPLATHVTWPTSWPRSGQSLTTTLRAGSGPLLTTVTVEVMAPPAATAAFDAEVVTPTSAL